MRLLLDQGLPRSALVYLRQCQIETSHVAELGMSRASDSQILERARQENAVVVTLVPTFTPSWPYPVMPCLPSFVSAAKGCAVRT